MAKQDFSQLLAQIEAFVKEDYDFETWIGEDGGYLMLKVRLQDMGECQGDAVLEVCPVPLDPEPESGIGLLQFYTTVAANIADSNFLPALHALNRLNLRCPLGAFHLFENDHQMYHRHTAVLEAGQAGVRQAKVALSLVVETVDQLMDEAILIAYDANKVLEE